jgi:ubiquinol oxidase
MLLPKSAYYLMESIENHAFHTYDEYLKNHQAELKAQPAPQIAINYYCDGDLYMFDEFQTNASCEFRRPKVDNLYDVFVNIRDDESEHVKTMVALQQPAAWLTFHSPHTVVELIPIEDRSKVLAPNMSYIEDNIEI